MPGFFDRVGDLVIQAGESAIEEEFNEGRLTGGNPQAAATQIPPAATTQPNVQAQQAAQNQSVAVAGVGLSQFQIAGLAVAGLLTVLLVVRLTR